VADGDTVNIDYVGSVDGVEFEGGSTGGNGTEVTIGVTQYIDDFLEQLIGREAGETFDINVTFPEDYGNETLNGKDAVFVTTVNHIVGTKIPELNDEFVSSNFAESNSWNTVEDLNEGVRTHLKDSAVSLYLQEFILENCEVASIPESLMTYQEEAMMAYYEDYAASYSMSVDDFLTSYLGVESADALLVQNKAQNEEQAKFYLVVQAIAEDAEIALSDDEVKEFFLEQYSEEEYTQLESEAGLPYMKMIVMNEKVLEELENNAKLA
jgi:trigger factor